ncbi:MAG: OmpA family protein [Myxococcales bacterium]|nr:OmpA family protein [Myxococcales bacterium]MDD9970340.1 OmpA family protein [Myxococcales bacterium]
MTIRRIGVCMLALTAGATLLGTSGCATPQEPRQLLDARAAYQKVSRGQAARLAPADLHEAKVKLTEAEESFKEDPESAQTYALAYVALRQAQTVEARSNTKAAAEQLKAAGKQREDLRDEELNRARAELSKEKQALARERQARAAAEERERDAMRKLAEAAALNVKEESRGTVIVLPGNVLFASGKYALTQAAQHKLTLVAGTLAPQSETHDIVVEGHTDSRGSRDFNMQLSEQRAVAVMNYLVSRGVVQESISAVGIGPGRPIADNSTRQGRAENRRVEIIVKPMEPK